MIRHRAAVIAFSLVTSLGIAAAVEAGSPSTVEDRGLETRSSETMVAALPIARFDLKDLQGVKIGEGQVWQSANGAEMSLDIFRLPPGSHGIHIHDVGRCDAPGFESAGGHFDRGAHSHGFKAASGPHTGDLPNLHVPPEGRIGTNFVLQQATVSELMRGDGAAVVVHANADDYQSNPAGESGPRIACGAITALAGQ